MSGNQQMFNKLIESFGPASKEVLLQQWYDDVNDGIQPGQNLREILDEGAGTARATHGFGDAWRSYWDTYSFGTEVFWRGIETITGTADTFTVDKPAGVEEDDLVIMTGLFTGLEPTLTPTIEGWTFIAQTRGGSGPSKMPSQWYRFATATEPADYTFGIDVVRGHIVFLTAFQGAETDQPFDSSNSVMGGANNDPKTPRTTSIVDQSWGLMMGGIIDPGQTTTAITPPTGWTVRGEAISSGLDLEAQIATKIMGPHEQIEYLEDEFDVTGAGSGRDWATCAVVIRASISGPDTATTFGDTFNRSDEALQGSTCDTGGMDQKWSADDANFAISSNVARSISGGNKWAYLPSGQLIAPQGVVTIEANVSLSGAGSNERVGFAYGLQYGNGYDNKWTVRMNHSTDKIELFDGGVTSRGTHTITPVTDQVYNLKMIMTYGDDVSIELDDVEVINWAASAAHWVDYQEASWIHLLSNSTLSNIHDISVTVAPPA